MSAKQQIRIPTNLLLLLLISLAQLFFPISHTSSTIIRFASTSFFFLFFFNWSRSFCYVYVGVGIIFYWLLMKKSPPRCYFHFIACLFVSYWFGILSFCQNKIFWKKWVFFFFFLISLDTAQEKSKWGLCITFRKRRVSLTKTTNTSLGHHKLSNSHEKSIHQGT